MSEISIANPVIRSADQAQQRWFFGGGVHSWLATAEETEGSAVERRRSLLRPLADPHGLARPPLGVDTSGPRLGADDRRRGLRR